MERNIPHSASESIDFYNRTLYSVLRSKSETKISGLEEVYLAMNSTMHPDARSFSPDYNALIYSVLRLPGCMRKVRRLVLGQNVHMFFTQGFEEIENWPIVTAAARRRICRYDGNETLAVFINSKSDIEDIIPMVTALQIEWNKLHELLQNVDESEIFSAVVEHSSDAFDALADKLLTSAEDLNRLYTIWKEKTVEWLLEIKSRRSEFRVKLLDSAMVHYSRAANFWLDEILDRIPDLTERPVYFVSSNLHSIANLVSGYGLQKENELQRFLDSGDEMKMLQEEWGRINRNALSSGKENLMYYILKKYQQSGYGKYTVNEQKEYETQNGIYRLSISSNFEVGAQVFDLKRFDFKTMDPRIRIPDIDQLKKSDAYILNIDYPLGMAAYHLFSKLSEKLERIEGIYVMGKAASLNGVRGDVIIPSVVHDMHSSNLYLFQNIFMTSDVEPYLKFGSILGGQKARSVSGSVLQIKTLLEAVYR